MSSTAQKLESGRSVKTRRDKSPTRLRVTQPMAITATNIHKTFRTGNVEVPVLRGVDVSIAEGEFVAIIGQSGSGKSTLLHLLGTLDKADEGEITIGQHNVNQMKSTARDRLRTARLV